MKNNIMKVFVSAASLFVAASCTNLDEIWYDKVTPETFYQTEGDIYAALYRPFTHAKWYMGESRFELGEESSDLFQTTTKGPHWYNGGYFVRLANHTWTPEDGSVSDTWRGTLMGVALSLDVKNDLSQVDYEAVGLTETDREEHMAQLDALIGYFYMRGLDYFGGLPIFTSNEGENIPRSTDKETFAHVEKIFLEALPKLAKRTTGSANDGAITQGSVAAFLVQLYFNAQSYIGEDRTADCEKYLDKLLAGEYGEYAVDYTNWQDPFDFDNKTSDEIVWGMPSEYKYLEYNWFYYRFYHYSAPLYFDADLPGPWNGAHLAPSRNPGGEIYDFNLGRPFESYDADDLRKQHYKYKGAKNYEGMFLFGPQFYPDGVTPLTGSQEYLDQPLFFDDMVARFHDIEVESSPYYGMDPKDLPSSVELGEETSGVRMVKIPIPNKANNNLRWNSHQAVIRLAEMLYTKAELLYNRGDLQGACDIINKVRARNFEGGNDTNPVTPANLDKYRMAKEWAIEFMGENLRRTCLIRWGMYHTEDWWAHEATNDINKCRFPVPTDAIAGNNALVQNPGY